ncbi:MAG TPA: AraC family transcriptional regulator [Bryobacteraceae bacterium]|nr:AraC family transcriptional regulator [Bryobacteraceae bacterium]
MNAGIDNRFWFTESQQIGFQQFNYKRRILYPARLQEEYNIVLCLKGSLDVTEADIAYKLVAGQALIGNSLQWRHSQYGGNGPCEGLSLIVSPRIMRRACAFEASRVGEAIPVFRGLRDARELIRVAEEAKQELNSKEPGKNEMLDALGRELLIRSLRLWREEPSFISCEALRLLPRRYYVSALDFMQSKGKSDFAVESMCSHIGLNSGDFNRLFRNCTGQTPLQVYNQLLIERAQNALRSGSFSVKEIAYELGFGSPSQFTAFFRRLTGTSPTEERIVSSHAGKCTSNKLLKPETRELITQN